MLLRERLRKIREGAGLSQAGFAKMVGCNASLIGAIERGAKLPGLVTAAGIERATRELKRPIRAAEWVSPKSVQQAERFGEGVDA